MPTALLDKPDEGLKLYQMAAEVSCDGLTREPGPHLPGPMW